MLKVDCQVSGKKMQRKEDKILNLEKTMSKLRDQNLQLKSILNKVKNSMEGKGILGSKKVIESHNMTGLPSSSKIVKKIKGGGGVRRD